MKRLGRFGVAAWLFEGDTLDQIWPEQKKLEPLFFWNYDTPKAGEPLSYGKTTLP